MIAAISPSYILTYHTVCGFAARVAGGQRRAANIVGLGVSKAILTLFCVSWRRRRRLAGMIEGRCSPGPAPGNLAAGVWLTGILDCLSGDGRISWRSSRLRSCSADQRQLAACCSGRARAWPDASVLVLQGIIFVFVVLASDADGWPNRFPKGNSPEHGRTDSIGIWTVPACRVGCAIRVPRHFCSSALGRRHHRTFRAHQSGPPKARCDGRHERLRNLLNYTAPPRVGACASRYHPAPCSRVYMPGLRCPE